MGLVNQIRKIEDSTGRKIEEIELSVFTKKEHEMLHIYVTSPSLKDYEGKFCYGPIMSGSDAGTSNPQYLKRLSELTGTKLDISERDAKKAMQTIQEKIEKEYEHKDKGNIKIENKSDFYIESKSK